MRLRARYLSLLGATLMIAGPLALAADAAASYSANAENNGVADLDASWICGNGVGGDGASVKLGGTARVKGIGIAVRFEATGNRPNFDMQSAVDGIEISLESGATVPKQPPLGGAGGNPYIYFVSKHPKTGEALGNYVLLGRCNGPSSGAARVQAGIMAGVASLASIGATGCSNKGSSVTANRRHDAGVRGAIVLSNRMDLNGQPAGHINESIDDAVTDIALGSFQADKAGNLPSGVGGNPTIKLLMWKTRGNTDASAVNFNTSTSSFTFADDGSAVNADDILTTDANGNKGFRTLGRCSELR